MTSSDEVGNMTTKIERDIKPFTKADFQRMKKIPRAKIIREALRLTQEEFAARYQIPIGTLRDWEQNRKPPDQTARAYLKVVAREPEVVRRALSSITLPTSKKGQHSMARMEMRAGVDGSRQHTAVEMWMDGKPLGHVYLDAATLEGHIHALARHRANMAEEVSQELDPGSRLEAHIDPIWRIPAKHPQQGIVLALRHPGFGWLSFVFPHKEARALAEGLTKSLPPDPK
jgi:putative transcriptional regulator